MNLYFLGDLPIGKVSFAYSATVLLFTLIIQ